jgi:hypothetical protein
MSNITTDAKGVSRSAQTTATQFVVPVVGSIEMDASATLVTLNQLAVSMPYDDKYVIALDTSGSKVLMESIQLAGSGSTFAASRKAGDDLKNLLKTILDTATKDDENGKNLPTELADDMKARFQEYFSNELSNILENVHLSYSVDTQGGADDMNTIFDNEACEIVAQQIPNSNYLAWSDASENFLANHIPLLDDDVIVFTFEVAQELRVDREEQKTGGAIADPTASVGGPVTSVSAGNAAGGVGGAFTTSQPGTATYIYQSRKIAFFVSVTGGTAAAAAAVAAAGVAGAGGSA